jgi:hypothetical protein
MTELNLPIEFTELLKCYQCDCVSAPYCTIGGELCLECFDYQHFQHKKPRAKFPGTFLKYCQGEAECDICMPNKTYSPKNGKLNFYVMRSPPDGDCMYTCISNALDQKVSVKELRRLVSLRQTKEMYDAYMDLYDMTHPVMNDTNDEYNEYNENNENENDRHSHSHINTTTGTTELPEFTTLEHIKSFDQFRHLIQLCGSEVGTGDCMWGDENALQICSNEFGITFVIFNEKGSIIQKVTPILDKIVPTNTIFCHRFVLLRLNGGTIGQEHYDLLKLNGDTIITLEKWEYLTKTITT